MSQVMRGLHWKRCLVYIDDILVFGNDFESALHSLELVLIRVAEYGLQLKSTKCNLLRTSVPFLGHIVGRAGLECDPNKLSAVANWIPPSTIKGVREFLGFTGYYRRFVPTTQQSRNLWCAYWGKAVNSNGQTLVRTLLRHCARFS